MTLDERVQELQAEYGPPPTDPMERSAWQYGIELVAKSPDRVAALASEHDAVHETLAETFNGFIADVEGDVAWEFVRFRRSEPLRAAVERVIRRPLWSHLVMKLNAVQRTRTVDRLTEEVADNIARLILFDPVYRSWFTDF